MSGVLAWLVMSAACDPAALLGSLARRDAVRCDVAQTKRSKLFRRALESKGRIAAKASGAFRFETTAPAASTLIVAKGRASFESSSGREVLSLDKLPKVSALLGTFSGVFTGRTEELLERFSASAECKGTTAKISLSPKDSTFEDIRLLTLTLEGDTLSGIAVDEKNGDRSELSLSACTSSGVTEALFEVP